MSDSSEIFPLPLYHGSSSLFIDKIKEHGLNGFNPLAKYDIQNILSRQFELLDIHYAAGNEWLTHRGSTERMLHQPDPRWQHGKTYLTCSLRVAKEYAGNEYGSEILTRCFMLKHLIEQLEIHDTKLYELWELHGPAELENRPRNPFIFTATNVEIRFLKHVHGLPMEHILEQIKNREQMDEVIFDNLLQTYLYYLEPGYSIYDYTVATI